MLEVLERNSSMSVIYDFEKNELRNTEPISRKTYINEFIRIIDRYFENYDTIKEYVDRDVRIGAIGIGVLFSGMISVRYCLRGSNTERPVMLLSDSEQVPIALAKLRIAIVEQIT